MKPKFKIGNIVRGIRCHSMGGRIISIDKIKHDGGRPKLIYTFEYFNRAYGKMRTMSLFGKYLELEPKN